jgi:2-polyprenyl-3-methyl-5-hydroxy-6-metoxy-1,4-benzoquinol methylase
MIDLRQRNRQPEQLDELSLAPAPRRRALAALRRFNALTRSAAAFWPAIAELACQQARPLRILDVASGGGDVPIALDLWGQHCGIPLEIEGCDRSVTAVDFAAEQAKKNGANVWFFPFDVLQGPLPIGYDVITCSLFLHHLEEPTAVDLLRRFSQTARRLVLVQDLVRSKIGYQLAYWGSRLLTTSRVVRADAPASVAAAFTIEEVFDLAYRAGMIDVIVEPRWAARFLLAWQRPDQQTATEGSEP